MVSESGCDQIIHNPTHRSGNCLDLLFIIPGVVASYVGTLVEPLTIVMYQL